MAVPAATLFVLTRAKLPAYKSHAMRYISFALRWNLVHRILVVDDFKAWRDEACEIMETQPELQVIAQAEDGEQAVHLATTLKPDLVVLDIGLPKLNGLTAAARIFKASPGTKIVFLSHNNDPEIVYAARSVGASGFVCKPKAATDLLNAITATIGDQRREEFYICPLCRLPAYT